MGATAAAGLLLTSCSAGLPARKQLIKTSFELQSEVVFTPRGWPQELRGDLYRPKSEKATPGILLIHGGGWTGGDKRHQMKSLAKRLAKRGYLVFNVTYRTTPEWQYPAPYDDLLQALAWMQENSQDLNLDPDRVATYGYSAGGHLAALVGLRARSQGIPVEAIVAGGAPSDLSLTRSELVENFLGGTRDEAPALYREASPVTHVSTESPPVFLYHARHDRIVWPDHSRILSKELGEKGIEHELVWTFGPGHISGFLFPGKAINSALSFLDEHLQTAP